MAGESNQAATASSPSACSSGLICHAMALRVKFRKTDVNHKPLRKTFPILSLGVNKGNRGGVYPQGLRVRGLNVEVLGEGFSLEDCSHAAVAIEEVPMEHVSKVGGGLRNHDEIQ